MKNWLITPQPRLKAFGLVSLLMVVNILAPCSLDMYTPAVPDMPAYFNTSAALINLTLLGFFLFFAIGMLVFGPISDRTGRKPVLVGGMLAYTIGSALCALSVSVEMLIVCRVIEALGAGSVNAVSVALVKDCFEENSRQKLLSILQVMAGVGPVAAPLIGGFILQFGPWQTTFWVLTAIGAVCTVGAFLFSESLPVEERTLDGLRSNFASLGRYVTRKDFMPFCFVVGVLNLPFMGYVAIGSYVYVDFFGFSSLEYSYFFALTSLFIIIGPLVHLKFQHLVHPRTLTWIILAVGIICAAGLFLVGESSAWAFCGVFILYTFFMSMARPYSTHILLMQCERDAGAASSVINFTATGLGAVGMALVVLPWPNYIVGVATLLGASNILGIIVWVALLRSSVKMKGLKD